MTQAEVVLPKVSGWVGQSLPAREHQRLVTGKGCFVDDIDRPGQLHAAILRSPHAHARIVAIDARRALALPGVHLVLTADDLPSDLPSIPLRLGERVDHRIGLQPPLARGRVRYVGEPVAVVVADSRYRAEDALDVMDVMYDPLPAVVDPAVALQPGAPLLHPELGSNLAARFFQVVGDVRTAMATADAVVEFECAVQRHAAVPLETRGLVAEWDPGARRLTVWGPTKVVHFNRQVLAQLLGLAEDQIRFVEPDVGGGFGARGEFYPEDYLIPYLALRTRRPVKWTEDRREHLLATNHSREQHYWLRAAVRSDGVILGLDCRILCNQGAYLRTHGVVVADIGSALLPGPYRLANFRAEVEVAFTNKTPMGTYRGPGRYEGTFARERLVDEIARRLGLDPVAVRRRNLLTPEDMPYDVGTGGLGTHTVYDSGDYPALLEAALCAVGSGGFPEEQARAREAGRYVGLGVGAFVEKAGLGPWESGRVRIDPETGRVQVLSGTAHLGQGIPTALAQVAADVLGVHPRAVDVIHGDTDQVPRGMGAWASRSTVMAGSAVHLAARTVRDRAVALAARLLEVAPVDLEAGPEGIGVRGAPRRGVGWRELAREAVRQGAPLDVDLDFRTDRMTYPGGVHAAVVEVDPETGQVRLLRYAIAYDVGRAVNPALVAGQLTGGAAQGIGGALLEELAYDGEGQMLSSTLMDYLLPTAAEMPAEFRLVVSEATPSPLNPLGVKGAGEGGCTGAGAAVANAVADALAPFGVRVDRLPLSPAEIRRLIDRAREEGSGRGHFVSESAGKAGLGPHR